MAKPSVTLSTTPDKFDVVNAPNIFTFTASFAGTTGTINDSMVYCDLEILDQNVEASSVIYSAGRFKFPPRANSVYVSDFHDILKTFVTFPYDSVDKSPLRSAYLYVDEKSGFSGGDFPTIAPETEGIVKYRIKYGIEWKPNADFIEIHSNTITSVDYAKYTINSVNAFANVGDIVNISVNSGLFTYYSGTASVLAISTSGGQTFITVDQLFNTTLDTLSGGSIAGTFNSITQATGTSSQFWSYNGTRQWFEKDMPLGFRYCLNQTSERTFLTDYGYDSTHPLQIRNTQGERVRFLADFSGSTGYQTGTISLAWVKTEYNYNGVIVATSSTALNLIDPVTGGLWSQKCFTLATFDNATITDNHLYNFKLQYSFFGTPRVIGQVWYKGLNSCSLFNNYRIKFLNKQGSWSYWNFNMDSKQTTTINRTEYKRPNQYDYTPACSGNKYSTSKLRGSAILSSNVVETFTMNTDWISEDDYKFLGQLVSSPEVFVYYDRNTLKVRSSQLGLEGYDVPGDNGHNIPIIITDNSYEYKTTNRDKLFNLTIAFKYAFDTNLQNQ